MRSEHNEVRSRSAAEVAFVVMRALATARLLWARDGALPIDMLPTLVEAPAEAIALTIDGLCGEGVAEVSERDATVRLSDRALLDLCSRPEPPPDLPPRASCRDGVRRTPPVGGGAASGEPD